MGSSVCFFNVYKFVKAVIRVCEFLGRGFLSLSSRSVLKGLKWGIAGYRLLRRALLKTVFGGTQKCVSGSKNGGGPLKVCVM